MTSKLKVGDPIKVISGKDQGKIGTIARIFPKVNKVLVENIGLVSRHTKPSAADPEGGIKRKEMPIAISKVAYFSSELEKTSKIGWNIEKGEKVKKIRFLKKNKTHFLEA